MMTLIPSPHNERQKPEAFVSLGVPINRAAREIISVFFVLAAIRILCCCEHIYILYVYILNKEFPQSHLHLVGMLRFMFMT